MKHTIKAHSPLGFETLRFRAVHGTEAVSQLFELQVDLVADNPSLDLKQLLGQPMTLEIEMADGGKRYLDGIVARASLLAREGNNTREWRYRATVRPWLWLLTRTRDSKIFQHRSVPQILQEVLSEYGFPVEARLTASYRTWAYCVQYQESDFDFLSRLMEHEGINYYFEHAMGAHTLVLADDNGSHPDLPGAASIPFFKAERVASVDLEAIDAFQAAEQIAPGAYVVDDYNFTTPRAQLAGQRASAAGHAHGDMEVYDWMGGYGEAGDAEHYSRIRLEGLQAERERAQGHAWARCLAPGYRFSLRGSPRDAANRAYLLVSVRYRFEDAGYASGGGAGGSAQPARYECDFVCQPATLPLRPARVTPQPRSKGPQTAVVVGPPGETIWTDEYGRVKVQFRWDRYGQHDDNSSCWLRVASGAAGAGMGQLNIPRIGQEVLVGFVGGLLDRPMVMGCTYNADMMPAHDLPARASRSVFVSRTLKGGPDQANSLVFDDLPGAEMLALHAEKNYRKSVEHDKRAEVGNDHREHIGRHAKHGIGGDKSTVVDNDYAHRVDGASTRDITGASTEFHRADFHHTSIGPSTVVRKNAHVQTYDATYDHHVTGPATSTWLAPHLLTHGARYDHSVGANHLHTVGGAHRRTVTGEHERTVGGDHDTTIGGEHTQFAGGDAVHTVAGTHTLTAMGDSHHVTPGTYSLGAHTIHIGAGGGGGGTIANVDTTKRSGGATTKIDFKATRYAVTVGVNLDWTTLKIASTVTNVSFDAVKFSATGANLALLQVETKFLGGKVELAKTVKGKKPVELATKMFEFKTIKYAFGGKKIVVEA